MGPTLRTLSYTTHDGDHDIESELQPCAVLQELTLDVLKSPPQGLIKRLPPSLRALNLRNIVFAQGLLADLPASSVALQTIILTAEFKSTLLETEKQSVSSIVLACKKAGIKLVGA